MIDTDPQDGFRQIILEADPEPNPWKPMTHAMAVACLGKLIEELGEAQSAAARCLIQGVDEVHPVTGKSNREWLEDEFADVAATVQLAENLFGLDFPRIFHRTIAKRKFLEAWFATLAETDEDGE